MLNVTSTITATPKETNKMAIVQPYDDDYDPLDAFMESIYETGDVTEQSGMSSNNPYQKGAYGDNNNNDKKPQMSLNFITMDQLMETGGWESDATQQGDKISYSNHMDEIKSISKTFKIVSRGNVNKTHELDDNEDSEDEREENERREFLKQLRSNIETTQDFMDVDEGDVSSDQVGGGTSAASTLRKKLPQESSSDMGRVFAGEGDVLDDYEIEAKKKSALELLEESRKGKELRPVDHASINYMPFRKNLYIVPRILAKLSLAEMALIRDTMQIKVRGKGCPAPADTWDHCGLSDRILNVINKSNFKAPFAIQKQAIPAIMCGRDVIGVAKTGSGKTLAFLLPMLRHILDQPSLGEGEGPIGLIMAPARELAFQIFNEAKKFCKPLGLRVACVYGGAGVADQIAVSKCN